MASWLHRICLKSVYSIRRQMMLSFGVSAFVTLTVVVLLANLATLQSSRAIKGDAEVLLREQVVNNVKISTRNIAEKLTATFDMLEGSAQLVAEITKDRISGYLDEGWEDDVFVPFFDMESQRNVYPLESPPLPLDWQSDLNIYKHNAEEHLQRRAFWLDNPATEGTVSSASASFSLQGLCNPNVTDPSALGYYPNCTAANNDITTGGSIQPTRTAQALYEKAADIGVLLKPIFEAQPFVFTVGVYFHNEGAGAAVNYPGYSVFAGGRYPSMGCDWMRSINAYTGEPFGSEEEIARCHPKGEMVSLRDQNPMERGYCEAFAMHPDGVVKYGPFETINKVLSVAIGRAVFDRLNGKFIGCVGFPVAIFDLATIIRGALLDEESTAVLVRISDGIVMASAGIGDPAMTWPGRHVLETGLIDHKVNFSPNNSSSYNAKEIRSLLKKESHKHCCGGVISLSPVPVPLDGSENDDPEFVLIQSINRDIFSSVYKLNTQIDDDAARVAVKTVATAAVGLIFTILVVLGVSIILTRPLLWMQKIARQIVNHTNEKGTALDRESKPASMGRCQPKTEIIELVDEFDNMIHGFSGDGGALVAEPSTQEIKNHLTWQSDFRHLYQPDSGHVALFMSRPAVHLRNQGGAKSSLKRGTSDTASRVSVGTDEEGSSANQVTERDVRSHVRLDAEVDKIVPAPPKKNFGSNLASNSDAKATTSIRTSGRMQLLRSSLLWWIITLIVLPSLVSTLVLWHIAARELETVIPSWIDMAAERSLKLEVKALRQVARSKATFAAVVLSQTVRDLHVLSRVAGWLLFDGISRSSGFTDTLLKTEECKFVRGECPFYRSDDYICPCDWKDPLSSRLPGTCDVNQEDQVQTCAPYECTSALHSRSAQRLFLAVQSSDSDTDGNRPGPVEFPASSYSPNTTSWYTSFADMPGSFSEENATGFSTTYDRARVTSASVVMELPVFNYASQLLSNQTMSSFFGLEADGLAAGFGGCYYSIVDMAHWSSTKNNLASTLAPDLCPEGKYGYDPRCRGWYVDTKKDFYTSKTGGHLTSPYLYQSERDDLIGITAAAPLANPTTNEFAGVAGIDFNPAVIRQSLRRGNQRSCTTFMISSTGDIRGADTVIGPDPSKEWEEGAISDLLFKNEVTPKNRDHFEYEVLPLIKGGDQGHRWLNRTSDAGSEEKCIVAYWPVRGTRLLPIDPSNFTRGTELSDVHLYSVGILCREQELRSAYDEIEEENSVDYLLLIYVSLVGFTILVFSIFAFVVALHMTRPMTLLLRLVRSINTGEVHDELPPLSEGSVEFQQVYASFAKLYKIVRISNYAFFSGNLEWAYHTTNDALQLFRKIDDRKAVAIACNNIGNVLHACTQDNRMLEGFEPLDGGASVLEVALTSFDQAIAAAEKDFDSTTDLGRKAEFAQQLADRLFNRGLFLLTIQSDPDRPEGTRPLALNDIKRTRELDVDVTGYWLSQRLLLDNSEHVFLRLLRRIQGLTAYDFDHELKDIWNVKELVDEADGLLFAAWNEPSAPLFRRISRSGRRQQLEMSVILLEVSRGDEAEAARLAMRMFVEDEYLLEQCFQVAANAVLRFGRTASALEFSPQALTSARADFREMSRPCKNYSIDIGKCLVFALELNERWEGDPLLEKLNENCLRLYDECCYNEDYMGLVAYTTQGTHTVRLGVKAENEGIQRATLDMSTTSLSEMAYPALPFAVQMLVDSAATIADDHDTYVILFTDGYSWDSYAFMAVKEQIEKLNHEGTSSIHTVIFGFDMEDEKTREECKLLCTATKLSFYIDVTLANIDSVFSRYAHLICGETASVYNLRGATMERF